MYSYYVCKNAIRKSVNASYHGVYSSDTISKSGYILTDILSKPDRTMFAKDHTQNTATEDT